MRKDIVFSVIIPVYNMELYIRRCLDSVISQTYQYLEIIIINDGSTDNSLEIIKSYAYKDDRITIIDKENEGIGCAYIDALNIVTGDYISFIDSDDYVDIDMYRILSSHAANGSPDIIQFGYQKFNIEGVITDRINFGEAYIVGNYNVAKYKYNKIPHPSIGLKVMKRTLFDHIVLLRQSIGIDVLISFQVFNKAKSMLVIEHEFYFIFMRENSVSRKRYDANSIRQLRAYHQSMLSLLKIIENKILLCSVLTAILDAYVVITNYFKNMNQEVDYKDLQNEYKTFFEINRYTLKQCKLKTRFKATIYRYMPEMYFFIFFHKIKR